MKLTRSIEMQPVPLGQALQITFLLRGPRGVISLTLSAAFTGSLASLTGDGLFSHTKRKVHEWDYLSAECPYLGGHPCWSDGSYSQATEACTLLLTRGSEAVFQMMEERYHRWLEGVSNE